ncbi:MAG TPA: PQQ-binding-like beta-propeller repeat protein, partial [Pirellulales bacterium]|nr:PQQ-binding-like beta-propeller repeat protein [Pirellulales bacterium]
MADEPRPATDAGNPFLPASAPDYGWPFVRGPTYDGHSPETNLADEWPDEGPPVLWSRTLGQGYSAFVAAGQQIYTQYQTLTGQYVVSLDAETGDMIWQYRYEMAYDPMGLYPGPRATPTLAAGRVYFAAPSGLVGCLSAEGELLWSLNVVEKFAGQGTGFGFAGTPVVRHGLVLLCVGGKGASLVALDAHDGSTVWQSGDDPASYVPAMPIVFDGREQVLGFLENAIVSCDLATGRQLWRRELSRGYNEHAAWPVYQEPLLWLSGPFQSGSQLFGLTGGDAPGVKVVWQSKLLSNDVCSSVLAEGCLFGFDLREAQSKLHRPSRGVFRCLDFASGKECWSTDRVGHASALVADGKLILFNDLGELILAHAETERYREFARVSLFGGEINWTAPALHRGRLFLRNQSRAACVYLGRPELLERRRGPPPLAARDIAQGGFRDLTALLGVEPEFAFDVPSRQWLRDWHLAGLALLAVAWFAATTVSLAVRAARGRMLASDTVRCTAQAFALLLGAAGTTALSLWRNDFVFTWPVCLFVLFQSLVDQVQVRRNASGAGSSRLKRWRGGAALLAFVGGCAGYYLLCRQLSLVTEWAFLCGFGAALPISLVRQWLAHRPR